MPRVSCQPALLDQPLESSRIPGNIDGMVGWRIDDGTGLLVIASIVGQLVAADVTLAGHPAVTTKAAVEHAIEGNTQCDIVLERAFRVGDQRAAQS